MIKNDLNSDAESLCCAQIQYASFLICRTKTSIQRGEVLLVLEGRPTQALTTSSCSLLKQRVHDRADVRFKLHVNQFYLSFRYTPPFDKERTVRYLMGRD